MLWYETAAGERAPHNAGGGAGCHRAVAADQCRATGEDRGLGSAGRRPGSPPRAELAKLLAAAFVGPTDRDAPAAAAVGTPARRSARARRASAHGAVGGSSRHHRGGDASTMSTVWHALGRHRCGPLPASGDGVAADAPSRHGVSITHPELWALWRADDGRAAQPSASRGVRAAPAGGSGRVHRGVSPQSADRRWACWATCLACQCRWAPSAPASKP
jgi:hypothetical protein